MHSPVTRYHERLWPSIWWFLGGLLIIPAILLVFAPVNGTAGVILAIACYCGYLALLAAGAPRIEVSGAQLRVGTASIPLALTGTVTSYADRMAARQAAGPGLDARAWTCLRGWVPSSLRIDITDDRDPVPYWLISTRDPDALAAAITAARSGEPGTGKEPRGREESRPREN